MEFVLLITIALAIIIAIFVAAITTFALLWILKVFFKIANLGCGLVTLIFASCLAFVFVVFAIIF